MLASLKPKYLATVRSGEKPVEGRMNFGNWEKKKLHEGMTITFRRKRPDGSIDEEDRVTVLVTYIHEYPTIRAMLEAEGVDRMLPGVPSLEIGIKKYEKFYPEANKHGMLALGLQVME